MSKITIEGGNKLKGEVSISGAKNSAVALIPAAILSNSTSVIYNLPHIRDIEYLIKILESLNCKYEIEGDTLRIDSSKIKNARIPESLSREMRASYYFMGSLLAKFKKVEMSFPGGCNIGNRPIDQHIKGFEALGAKVVQEKNKFFIKAKKLKGARILLDIASVGATINIMIAATTAEGRTTIENAAREPEIVNIASFLITMGAKIKGAGTDTIIIDGVKELGKGVIEVLPDRIETGTYLIMGALLGKDLVIKNVIVEHVGVLLSKLREAGADFKISNDTITISQIKNMKPLFVKTAPYPGFPTDLQQPLTTMLTQANGKSRIIETIYESRFRNVEYLETMGAKTEIVGNILKIYGKTSLKGKNVYSTDLRAGASLLIAGLIAKGTTTIDNIELILRGYDNVIEKLQKIGAKIELIP